MVGTWLGEIRSCSSLAVLPGCCLTKFAHLLAVPCTCLLADLCIRNTVSRNTRVAQIFAINPTTLLNLTSVIPFPAPRDRLQTFFGLLRSSVSHSFSSLSLCDFPLLSLSLSSPITINVTIRLIFILKTRRASVSCYGFKGRRNTHILHDFGVVVRPRPFY